MSDMVLSYQARSWTYGKLDGDAFEDVGLECTASTIFLWGAFFQFGEEGALQ